MNFTQKIRRDILRAPSETREEQLATFAAFLETSGSLMREGETAGFSFTNENEDVAEYFLALCERLFHVRMTVVEAVRDPKYGRNKLTLSYAGEEGVRCNEALSAFFAEALSAAEPPRKDAVLHSYLRGAFLGGGSCTIPRGGAKTGYHLEFVFPHARAAAAFCVLLDRLQLIAGTLPRGEKQVVYCKNRDSISDFLALSGAHNALRRLETVAADREHNNNENRISNCFSGNADRAAIASAAQCAAFAAMQKSGQLDLLPPPLAQAARARLEAPLLSLSELAETLGISKSCLNHRMRKLMQIYGTGS